MVEEREDSFRSRAAEKKFKFKQYIVEEHKGDNYRRSTKQ
jgi:hypothetical protein